MESNDEFIPKDYYKILEIEYDANDEKIRLNYRKLALKWHPDKHKGDTSITAKFQEINEAYRGHRGQENRAAQSEDEWVKADSDNPVNFRVVTYDLSGNYEIDKYTLREYLARFKGMILTCNGLGISHSTPWSQQLTENDEFAET